MKNFMITCLLILAVSAVWANTYTVTNLNDSGDGSLRWAIEQANATAGQHTIDFNVTGTITLVTALPSITRDYTIIDASSQWQGTWPDGAPGIVIDGTDLLNTSVGIYMNGASYCEIRGLHITNFAADQCKAILTFNSANNNIIGGDGAGMRNVITNSYTGIELRSSYNTIIGNYIGVAPDGLTAAPNNQRGVYINSYYHNIIGGSTEAERNIISGNTNYGIYIGGQNTIVKGNYIGTDKNGTSALPNGNDGIIVTEQNNTIGGTETGAGNLISGNAGDGVYLLGADNNTILGNYIGTDKNGTSALGNGNAGVYIAGGANNNVIGGTSAAARNIISANNHSGVMITGSTQNQVEGNYIGTDVNGTADLGNTFYGVVLFGGAQSNTIGGTVSGSGNTISGNDASGVAIRQFNTNNNLVQGNYIGTTADGISHRGNYDHGVYIGEGAKYNTIGGTVAAARNIIGGNELSGVTVENNGTNGNIICGNYIGLNVLGNYRRNTDHGVYVRDGADGTIIGGDTENDRNIISCNNSHGIKVGRTNYAETTNTIIKNNYIGTDPTGELDKGNSYYGIFVSAPSSNTQIINNLISGNNGGSGISLKDGPNTVKGNIIGSDKDQETALPNSSDGILVDCENNTIGGANAGEGNFIAWNGGDGIQIQLSNNTVYGNTICFNDDNGVRIAGYGEHADNNIIGGTNPGEANTIYSNGINGVQVYGMYDPDGYDFRYTDYNRISGNSIYDNTALGIDLVESGNGPGTAPHISAPVLSTTNLNANTLHIEGDGAGSAATIEVFIADNGTSGEGKTYLGSLTADTSRAAGDFSGDLDVSGFDIAAGDNIVATTTHTDNNTSEFSAVSIVTEANTIISAQTGDWNSTSTWIGGQIPASTNDVVVYEGHTITVNSAQSCQKLTLQTGSELTLLAGLPTAATGYDFAESSTVNYANAAKGNQTIEAAASYGNLVLSGTGNKTANAALNVAGDLEINNSAVFLSNQALAVDGNLIANGTAQFNPAGNSSINGSFTLSENSSCQNNGLLSVDGAILLQNNAVLSLGNNLDANSDVAIGADAVLNGGSATINMAGDWANNGTWNYGTSTVVFDEPSSEQAISFAGAIENEIQIGSSSTVISSKYPFYTFYEANRTQMLYLGSDIGQPGIITGLQFNLSQASGDDKNDLTNFVVKLKETTDSDWSGSSNYVNMDDATLVFSSNPYSMPIETGWFTITFDSQFNYTDSGNNLIVEINWGANSFWAGYSERYKVYGTTRNYTCVNYGYSYSANPSYDGNSDMLPNVKFNFIGSAATGNFNNLTISTAGAPGTTTSQSNLHIHNDLLIESGSELDMGQNELTVDGSITYNGPISYCTSQNIVGVGDFVFAAGGIDIMQITPLSGNMGNTEVVAKKGTTCPPNAFGSNCLAAPFAIFRYFNITPADNQTATVRFYYLAEELNGQVHGSFMRAYHWNSSSNQWEAVGIYSSHGGSGTMEDPYYIEYSGIEDYSPFVLSSEDDPTLPVELSSFSVIMQNEIPLVCWTTQTETENLGWNIYRSTQENGFEQNNYLQINADLIGGMGTVTAPTEYQYFDEYPILENTLYWYWLQSVSFSGELEMFGPVYFDSGDPGNVANLPDRSFLNNNFPNPFNPTTTIKFGVKAGETGKLSIYNIRGQLVHKQKFQEGYHQFVWNAQNKASGVYFYRLRTTTYVKTNKMILLR